MLRILGRTLGICSFIMSRCFIVEYVLGLFRPCAAIRLLANRFCFGFWQVNILDHATSRVSNCLVRTYFSNASDA